MARLRSALNAPQKAAAQGSAPPGHGKWEKPAETENQQLRVGQMRVSKVGQVRLDMASNEYVGGVVLVIGPVIEFSPAPEAACRWVRPGSVYANISVKVTCCGIVMLLPGLRGT